MLIFEEISETRFVEVTNKGIVGKNLERRRKRRCKGEKETTNLLIIISPPEKFPKVAHEKSWITHVKRAIERERDQTKVNKSNQIKSNQIK